MSETKILDIHDNLFSFHERTQFYNFLRQSFYKTTGGDIYMANNNSEQLFSPFIETDVREMGFLDTDGYKNLCDKYNLTSMKVVQYRVNLSTVCDKNYIHIDNKGLTLLYFSNLNWEVSWGGHTLFMDDHLTEAKYTCLNKPGRVAVFDGSIPHMIMTPSFVCPEFRYSFVIQYGHIDS